MNKTIRIGNEVLTVVTAPDATLREAEELYETLTREYLALGYKPIREVWDAFDGEDDIKAMRITEEMREILRSSTARYSPANRERMVRRYTQLSRKKAEICRPIHLAESKTAEATAMLQVQGYLVIECVRTKSGEQRYTSLSEIPDAYLGVIQDAVFATNTSFFHNHLLTKYHQ